MGMVIGFPSRSFATSVHKLGLVELGWNVMDPQKMSYAHIHPRGQDTTLNTTYIMGHTISLTLYSVGKLAEQWMKNGSNLSMWMKNCWNGWKYDRRMYKPTIYVVPSVV